MYNVVWDIHFYVKNYTYAALNRRCDIDKRLRRKWEFLGILPRPGAPYNLAELIIAAKCKSLAWQAREGERAIIVVIRRAFMADRIYYERYKSESLERSARTGGFSPRDFARTLYFTLNAAFSNCPFVLRFGIGTRLSGRDIRGSLILNEAVVKV